MSASSQVTRQDRSAEFGEQVRQANVEKTPLRLVGGGTKAFYGRPVDGETLELSGHQGITFYDPAELVVSVRTGTPLSALEATLADAGQQLACEPPHFGPNATVGGMIATGLSGPRRPWAGAVRDFVLGTRVITHQGEEVRFGGEVMKNVAGYDLSRLMVGGLGILGPITEVSLKVLPQPLASHSLQLELSLPVALEKLAAWGQRPLPITAAAYSDGRLLLRLEGGHGSVEATAKSLGGEPLDNGFWTELREHRLPFFQRDTDTRPLWRLSLPLNIPPLTLAGDWLLDWGGAQRWLRSDVPATEIRALASARGGHATCFTPGAAEPFTPLPAALARYHRALKAQLDPHGIFNPGRLYAEV